MVEADCWPGCQTSLSREVPRAKSDEACFAWLPYILVRVSLLKRLAYCISGEMRERERERKNILCMFYSGQLNGGSFCLLWGCVNKLSALHFYDILDRRKRHFKAILGCINSFA